MIEKALYYMKPHLGIAPDSTIDVYTDDPDVIAALETFEAVAYVEPFERSGMFRCHLNPQYTNEGAVLDALRARLDSAKLQDCWNDALSDLDE